VLKEFELDCYFRSIVESSVAGIRKPDPALFAMGIQALQLQATEVLVIGDSYRKDIYPASTLGCKTIWLKNVCWEDEAVEKENRPTAIINSIEHLPATVSKILSREL
jgi:putative hydrolase of the HAD superfamily